MLILSSDSEREREREGEKTNMLKPTYFFHMIIMVFTYTNLCEKSLTFF